VTTSLAQPRAPVEDGDAPSPLVVGRQSRLIVRDIHDRIDRRPRRISPNDACISSPRCSISPRRTRPSDQSETHIRPSTVNAGGRIPRITHLRASHRGAPAGL
jgi:hypothetical protein